MAGNAMSTAGEEMRYPIGRYNPPARISAEQRKIWIDDLSHFPGTLRQAVADLDDVQLDTSYRDGGWTVRQVIHHLPDSHLNSYVRFKLALTEDTPAVKGYQEAAWAELTDARSGPVDLSLSLLDSLHGRWVILLRAMTEADFERSFHHSELGEVTLGRMLGLYAWHGEHHLAHISKLRLRQRW